MNKKLLDKEDHDKKGVLEYKHQRNNPSNKKMVLCKFCKNDSQGVTAELFIHTCPLSDTIKSWLLAMSQYLKEFPCWNYCLKIH